MPVKFIFNGVAYTYKELCELRKQKKQELIDVNKRLQQIDESQVDVN